MSGHIYRDGGEGLLQAFRDLGVDVIFSSPGSEWAPVWEAMARQDASGAPGPRYLDLWHETLAVDMAIGYTLLTGRMQAVLLHATPGLLQGACGIHGALLAEIPMLVFSSEANSYGERESVDPGSQWYRNLSVVGGPHSVAAPFVKWSNQIPGIETVYEFTKRAGELSQRQPRGPVYLNAPVEMLLEEWTPSPFQQPVVLAARKISPQEDIEALVALVRAAEEPVIMVESAGKDAEGFRALVEFAEAFAIPVIEPQSNVCGNFPKEHPLYLGNEIGALRETADLVLLVQCRAPWYPPSNKPKNARTVVIDPVPQRPQVVHQVLFADQYLEGETADTLRRAAAMAVPSEYNARRERHAATSAARRAELAKAEEEATQAAKIRAVALIAALRDAVPDDTVFIDETITHSRLVQQHLTWDEPHRYFYVQGGLGQGIGVALGAKLASPEKFVVLTVGDGTLLYNPIVQALSAAKNFDLPVLIVVFNNRKYLSMQYNHTRFYPDGVAKEENYPYGVQLGDQPPLERFGEPFGMHTEMVDDPARLEAALAAAVEAVSGGTTAILNVMLER